MPKLDDTAGDKIDACLRWFEEDLRPGQAKASEHEASSSRPSWAEDLLFGGVPFSAQRVALFLRAIIKNPDLVILDEAFSGMDDGVRDRCLLFLAHGEAKQYSSSEKKTHCRAIRHREGWTDKSRRPDRRSGTALHQPRPRKRFLAAFENGSAYRRLIQASRRGLGDWTVRLRGTIGDGMRFGGCRKHLDLN